MILVARISDRRAEVARVQPDGEIDRGDQQRERRGRDHAPPEFRRGLVLETDAEMDRRPFPEKDFSEIEAGRDLADFVAHHPRDERRLRVVDDRAILLIEPAFPRPDRRLDCANAKRRDAVFQTAAFGVENLSLPPKPTRQPGENFCGPRSRTNQRGARSFTVRDLSRRAFSK